MKQINREINKWNHAIHDIKSGNRESFIALVKIGGGDDFYARECTDEEALTQCNLEKESLEHLKWKMEP